MTDPTSAQPSYVTKPSHSNVANMSNLDSSAIISWGKNKLKALEDDGQVTRAEVDGWVSCEEKLVASQVIALIVRYLYSVLIRDDVKKVFQNGELSVEHLAAFEEVKRVITRMVARRQQSLGAIGSGAITPSRNEAASVVVVDIAESTSGDDEDEFSESTSGVDQDNFSDSTEDVKEDSVTETVTDLSPVVEGAVKFAMDQAAPGVARVLGKEKEEFRMMSIPMEEPTVITSASRKRPRADHVVGVDSDAGSAGPANGSHFGKWSSVR